VRDLPPASGSREALDSTDGKVRDRQVQVRAEILEWIIIVLIAVEILLFLK